MRCIYCRKSVFNKLDPITEVLGQKIHRSCYGILVETWVLFLKEIKGVLSA